MIDSYVDKNTTPSPMTRILILGSGFAGIEVFRKLQKKFRNDKHVKIFLVSKDNYILFTPMLPEVATGMIETRHIVTPVRSFIDRAKFYQAEVESINLSRREVTISHYIGNQVKPTTETEHILSYDYLVIALGSQTNFFGNDDIQDNCLTMKDIDDAIILRNHVLNCLEQANLETADVELSKKLLTFVVVGGGFNGVETVGALNDFVRNTIRNYYPDINMAHVSITLVSADSNILSQIDEDLGERALEKLKIRGVEFILNTQVKSATKDSIELHDGKSLYSFTVVWSAGVRPAEVASKLPCEHDKHNRIIANSYLEVPGYDGKVYAIGDCASIVDPASGKPYPPTAQHAIRQGEILAHNIIKDIERKSAAKKKINYKARGMMAEIGEHYGIAKLFGLKFHGFIAWWLWRTFYLFKLPTTKKKIKVIGDWTFDLLFSPDVAMIKRFNSQRQIRREDTSDTIHGESNWVTS